MINEDLFNSKSESPIEERFWLVAQHKIKGLKQQYSIVHGFFIRVDFAIPDVKLIIECDGYEYHNRTRKMRKRDYFRDKILKFYGWKVIRLQGSEINRDVVRTYKLLRIRELKRTVKECRNRYLKQRREIRRKILDAGSEYG